MPFVPCVPCQHVSICVPCVPCLGVSMCAMSACVHVCALRAMCTSPGSIKNGAMKGSEIPVLSSGKDREQIATPFFCLTVTHYLQSRDL